MCRCHSSTTVGCALSFLSLMWCLSLISGPYMIFFQGDDKLSEIVSMLEQSSQAGCLQSSYLLWEHKRRAAVSFFLHCKNQLLRNIFLHSVVSLFSTPGQKQIWLRNLFFLFRWWIQADTFSVWEPSGTMLARDAGKHRCVIWRKGIIVIYDSVFDG